MSDFVATEADLYFDFNFPITTNTANTPFETFSLDEFSETQEIIVYPNPSDTVVTIEATSTIQHVKRYDVQRSVIFFKDTNSQTATIDISQFVNGMYLWALIPI